MFDTSSSFNSTAIYPPGWEPIGHSNVATIAPAPRRRGDNRLLDSERIGAGPADSAIFPQGEVGLRSFDNPDEMARTLPLWGVQFQQLGAGRFCGSIFVAHTARVQAGVIEFFPGVFVRGEVPAGCMMIAIALQQDGPLSNRGIPLSRDAAMVICHAEEIDFRTVHPCRFFVLVAPREQVEARALKILGSTLGSLRRHEQVQIKDPKSLRARLETLARDMQTRLLACPQALCRREKAAALEDELFDPVLGALRSPDPAGACDPQSGHSRLAWKAEQIMREHLPEPLSIIDLCRAVGAAERTLHLAFREEFGTSPKAYFKMLRLNGARRDLLRSNGQNVTDIAIKWDFLHFGWFSHDYRSMFGESPSTTLRHAQ